MNKPLFKCYSVLLVEKKDGRKKYENEPKHVFGLLSGKNKKEVVEKCKSNYPSYEVKKITMNPDEVVDTWEKEPVKKEKIQNHRHQEKDIGQKTEGKSTKKRRSRARKESLLKEELKEKLKKKKKRGRPRKAKSE